MFLLLPLLLSTLLHFTFVQSVKPFGTQAVKIWQLQQRNKPTTLIDAAQSLPSGIVEGTFTQPLDHFNPKNTFTFEQHYWVNPTFYKEGGPVILIDGGEDSGLDRLPYIVTGVGAKLANATGGLALVLEHRYYGQSIPVANFSTDSLRWLTNDQAFADSANFLQHVNLTTSTGIQGDFTAPKRPYIYYGGSYAGARSAIMKVKYPELVFGAISSSGVSFATIPLWQYGDVVRNATPDCSAAVSKAIETVNLALERPELNSELKEMFGLTGLADDDFGSTLTFNLGGWQNHNWDPSIDEDDWTPFCELIATKLSNTSAQSGTLGNLEVGYEFLNYANYIKNELVPLCGDESIEECFGTTNSTQFQADDLSQTWRSWQFQVCTAWGFFINAPPANIPPIIPNSVTVPYLAKICKQAYPPGKFFQVPEEPDVESVNKYGGLNIAADRLAIIGGEFDPWRPATPESSYANLRPREDTILRPFKLIPGAVHHWDENGLEDTSAEPPEIQAIHNAEIAFVQEWLKEL
ncbi:hypothetical protein Clacol_003472 [Clathrus columnatus]|uniref:Peptidase S28 n=1 Tax=Clathrus columnatus TaxID=1419009 RepID=A0AAV5ABE5_9AGAM|nr:hypothetical protein Clacol_003472 [Clathrus columnatus]